MSNATEWEAQRWHLPDQRGSLVEHPDTGNPGVHLGEMAVADYHSWSGMRTFNWCEAQWAFQRIEPRTERDGNMTVGLGVHRVLADIARTKAPDDADLHALWVSAALAEPALIPYEADVLGVVARVLRWETARHALTHNEGSEVKVEGEVAGVRMRARIDLVEQNSGELVMSDWKLGIRPEVGVESIPVRQTVLYSALYHPEPQRVRVYHLADETITDLSLESRAGHKIMAEVSQWVESTAARSAASCSAGVFEVNPTPGCRSCPYRDVCPGSQVTSLVGGCGW